jgi:hypothetical protein
MKGCGVIVHVSLLFNITWQVYNVHTGVQTSDPVLAHDLSKYKTRINQNIHFLTSKYTLHAAPLLSHQTHKDVISGHCTDCLWFLVTLSDNISVHYG